MIYVYIVAGRDLLYIEGGESRNRVFDYYGAHRKVYRISIIN